MLVGEMNVKFAMLASNPADKYFSYHLRFRVGIGSCSYLVSYGLTIITRANEFIVKLRVLFTLNVVSAVEEIHLREEDPKLYHDDTLRLLRLFYALQMEILYEISHAISITTRPNIGLFVLILMHFPC